MTNETRRKDDARADDKLHWGEACSICDDTGKAFGKVCVCRVTTTASAERCNCGTHTKEACDLAGVCGQGKEATTASASGERCEACKGTGYFYEDDSEVGAVARECEGCDYHATAPSREGATLDFDKVLIEFDRLCAIPKTPGYCAGATYTRSEALAMAIAQQGAAQATVTVERNRVWIAKGAQSFMLAYEADTTEELSWYADKLRSVLSGITPCVKSGASVAQEGEPAHPLDMPLPCDVKVGASTIRKGCKLGTLVLRAQSLHRMLMEHIPQPTPEQQAAFQALLARGPDVLAASSSTEASDEA